jgi:phage gp29-like protein
LLPDGFPDKLNNGEFMPKINNNLLKDINYANASYLLRNGMLPNPDKVLRLQGRTYQTFRDLKSDPHVWSCIQSRKAGLLSLDFKINPNGASDAIVHEVELMLSNLDMNRIERDILEAPLFGYQPLEIKWALTDSRRSMLVPVDIIAKPQEWFFFDSDRKLRYKAEGAPDGIPVPAEKILIVSYEADYINPYGNSLLSKCYWPVFFKTNSLKFWVKFAEKFGMPVMLGHYSRGATESEAQQLADSLNAVAEDSVIVVPDDLSLELHEASKGSSSELFRDLIKFCNAEISKTILSQTLTTELDMGSYAAAQTHFKVRKEVILSDISLIESFMNKLIRLFVEMNYSSPAPKFSLVMNDADDMQMVERDTKLTQTGQLKFSKEYWMRTYGFKEDELQA